MCKKVVVIAGGRYQLSGIKELKKQGFYVIVFDKIEYQPTKQIADELILIDIKDTKQMIQYLDKKNHKISFIMSFATELALSSVVKLKEYYNIPHSITKHDVNFSNNKYLQNKIKSKAKIAHAKYYKINSKNTFIELIHKHKMKFPCIIKPLDSAGSRGVDVVNNMKEFKTAFNEALKYTTKKYILVEEFITGIEFTLDAFVNNNTVDILAIAEKYKPINKLTVSTQLFYNSPLSIKIKKKVSKVINKYLTCAKLNNTIIHLEFIYNLKNKNIYIIETAVRSGGFGVFDEILPLVTKTNIVKYFVNINLGKFNKKIKNKNNSVLLKFFTANEGIFEGVYIVNKNLKFKNLYYNINYNNISKKYNINNDSSRSMLGYIVCHGKNWKNVIKKTTIIDNNIKFIISKG